MPLREKILINCSSRPEPPKPKDDFFSMGKVARKQMLNCAPTMNVSDIYGIKKRLFNAGSNRNLLNSPSHGKG